MAKIVLLFGPWCQNQRLLNIKKQIVSKRDNSSMKNNTLIG